jgi:hypothetical protein
MINQSPKDENRVTYWNFMYIKYAGTLRSIRNNIPLLTPNVQCTVFWSLWHFYPTSDTKCTMFSHCWTPIVLARLQKTPIDLLHSFISDSTSRRCDLSFTMSSDPLMSCLGAVLGCLLCSFFYLCLSWMLTADWLLLTDSGYVWMLLKSSLCVRNRRHFVARLALSWIPTIWFRRRRIFIFR